MAVNAAFANASRPVLRLAQHRLERVPVLRVCQIAARREARVREGSGLVLRLTLAAVRHVIRVARNIAEAENEFLSN